MEEQVETGAIKLDAGRGSAVDRSVHVTAGEGSAPDTSVHVTAGFGGTPAPAPNLIPQGSGRDAETQHQRALAKLIPGSAEFNQLVRSRRAGKRYMQHFMFWAHQKEGRRGRS